jgi:hypothetical protein
MTEKSRGDCISSKKIKFYFPTDIGPGVSLFLLESLVFRRERLKFKSNPV